MQKKMHEELKDYLKSIGFNEREIEKLFLKMGTRDLDLIKSKIEDYKEILNLSNSEVRKIIVTFPVLLSKYTNIDSNTSIKGKINAYKDLLNISDSQIRKMILSYPQLLALDTYSDNEGSIKGKVNFYKNLFNVNDDEIKKLIVRFPQILGFDNTSDSETSVKSKIKVYKKLLDLSDDEIRVMMRKFPQLLCLDATGDGENSVKSKIKFYKEFLNLNDMEVRKILISLPSSLGYDIKSDSEKSIKNKIKFYCNAFGLGVNEVKNMILNAPPLLGYDTSSDKSSSIKTKIKKLKQIIPFDIIRELAIKNPMILTTPAQSFKIKYMIVNLMDDKKQYYDSRFILNEKRLWARFCYLQSINANKGIIHADEKYFNKRFGVSSEELMKTYPLDRETVEEIEKAYWKKTGEKIMLDSEECKELGFERE